VFLKLGKIDGIAVYVPEETILKEMAAKIEKVKPSFFFEPVRELSDTPAVDIATSYGLEGRGVGVRVPVDAIFFSPPRRPQRFWGPPSFLAKCYRGFFLLQ
jgi:hypothetical protein